MIGESPTTYLTLTVERTKATAKQDNLTARAVFHDGSVFTRNWGIKKDSTPPSDLTIMMMSLEQIQVAAVAEMKDVVKRAVEKAAEKIADGGTAEKKELVEWINHHLRVFNLVILHPDSNEFCNLIVIGDMWGGKYALESKATRKRSYTKRDISDLLPFKIGLLFSSLA